MSIRKVTISATSNNLNEVLKSLNIPTEDLVLTLDLEVEDSKDTYTYLIESDKILDWNFKDEEIDNKNLEDESDREITIIKLLIDNLKNPEQVYNFLKYTFEEKTKSPAWRFSVKVISNILSSMSSDKTRVLTIQDRIFIKLLEMYYTDLDKITMFTDIAEKLENRWYSVHKYSSFEQFFKFMFNVK